MLEIGRRTMLGAIGAGAMLGTAAPALAKGGGKARKIDFNDKDDRFRAFMQMRGALDGQLVIGYVSGAYFGVVGSEMTPLWDVVGVTFARFRKRDDGGYDGVTGEIAHFIDPKTGEAPGTFHNPYTGKMITDPRKNLPPAKIIMRPDLGMEVPKDIPGTQFIHELRAPQVRGNDVWMTESSRVTMQPPGAPNAFHYNEVVTLHSSLSDLEKPGAMRAPCLANVTIVCDWRPWMEMPAGHPGHLLMTTTSGRYGASMDMLPAPWIAASRKYNPQILQDPGSLIEALWKTL